MALGRKKIPHSCLKGKVSFRKMICRAFCRSIQYVSKLNFFNYFLILGQKPMSDPGFFSL